MRVLLIEENRDLAGAMFDYFVEKGHEAEVAWDGIAGLSLAMSGLHDAIVVGADLPGLSGIALCQKLVGAALVERPLILLSNRPLSVDEKILAIEAGVHEFIEFPATPEKMLACLKKHLRLVGWGDMPGLLFPRNKYIG